MPTMVDPRQWREHYALLITAVTLVAMLLPPCALTEADSNCLYKYKEHLNLHPNCNPYPGGMWLECKVEIPLNASNISIGWFLNCMELTNDSHVTILTQDMYTASDHLIRSRLMISDITDDYAGDYTCNILGDEEYIPSDLFRLPDQTYVEVNLALGPCVDGDVIGLQKSDEKCAVITEDNPIPQSLICAEPVATSTHDIPVTSTPIILTTPSSSLPTTTTVVQATSSPSPSPSPSPTPSSPSSPPILSPPSTTSPSPTPMTTDHTRGPPSSPNTSSSTDIWLYVVVAVAAVFFIIIVVLVIVCMCMCLRRGQKVAFDEPTVKPQVNGKFTPNVMLENTTYQGDANSMLSEAQLPNSQPLGIFNTSDYNTLAMGDYEVVNPPPHSDYERLQRPTLTTGMMPRFASPEAVAFTPSTTMTSIFTHTTTPHSTTKNSTAATGIVPPPLPSTARRGNMKLRSSPDTSATADSVFHTGSAEVISPVEQRNRMDSTAMLIPHDRKGSDTMPADFEGLYTPNSHQKKSPSPPRVSHPLQKIPETGASFPEPTNPYPFPSGSYESIPGKDPHSMPTGQQYEKPIPSPKRSPHLCTTTLPVCSSPTSPPHSDSSSSKQNPSTMHVLSSEKRRRGDCKTANGRTQHESLQISSPIYHSLEQPTYASIQPNGSPPELKDISGPPVYPETADCTADSDFSANESFTPGFPVCSADFAETPGEHLDGNSVPKSKLRPQRVSNDCSSDFTGDSDYPQVDSTADFTGGSSSTAYPESDWTGGHSTGGRETITPSLPYNGTLGTALSHSSSSTNSSGHTPTLIPNGNCSTIAIYPSIIAGTSHTVPVSGSSAVGDVSGATSQTMNPPRNHYKQLDPATMEPHLKYTRLNVGKLTAV